ncbi:O-acetyl-ADP-ribose deacetylase [Epidermidibacterium keratini]|uniref:O-acetyl-ADP-ribose deacetylase n=1 Tax=Epidermidibacterium keratini TaxID=1891644 RepID=A0A7L4YKT9_9ACTN|nr:O-acetyl-ADP-ribose deacetylase [Epidermidibacterium keratini]QHB99438.1 O-acetyl-ADP-ribose deacetylase [Epidermidibacterium keratini]
MSTQSAQSANIEAIKGDITAIEVDAVVNAANSSLMGGGGVDGAIHRAAGPELLEHSKELRRDYPDGFPVGAAAAIPAGQLPAQWVIQTVGPNWNVGERDESLLRSCFTSALDEAVRVGARSVAFPAISAGIYGWDPKTVARVAVSAVRESARLADLDRVVFVLFNDDLLQLFTAELDN